MYFKRNVYFINISSLFWNALKLYVFYCFLFQQLQKENWFCLVQLLLLLICECASYSHFIYCCTDQLVSFKSVIWIIYCLTLIMQLQKILITGTNRGLGKQLVKCLAKNRPDLHLCLTSRTNIAQAEKSWKSQFPNHQITCLPLDLMSDQSIDQFFKILKANNYVFQYLVNNAAIGADQGGKIPQPQLAERTFRCNTTKTIQLTKRMILENYLSDDARVVNVSSGMGSLVDQPQDKQKLLDDPDNVTEENIQKYIKQYIKECQQKKLTWYDSCYGTSKLFLNSWSRFVLQEKLMKQKQIAICMSPGPCKTDMGPPNPRFTAQEGAGFIYDSIVRENPKKGVFYHTGNQRDFKWCGVPTD